MEWTQLWFCAYFFKEVSWLKNCRISPRNFSTLHSKTISIPSNQIASLVYNTPIVFVLLPFRPRNAQQCNRLRIIRPTCGDHLCDGWANNKKNKDRASIEHNVIHQSSPVTTILRLPQHVCSSSSCPQWSVTSITNKTGNSTLWKNIQLPFSTDPVQINPPLNIPKSHANWYQPDSRIQNSFLALCHPVCLQKQS